MKYRAMAAAALLLAACTVANPGYVGSGGGEPDSGIPSDGAMTSRDLTTGHPLDLKAVCATGERQCLATSGSAACVGGQYQLDRKCPMDSLCTSGYCTPPPPSATTPVGQSCELGGAAQENQCFSGVTDTLSCQPFVTDAAGMTVSFVCAHSVGMGLPGAPCTDGSSCRTGFCGSNGTCFRACQAVVDCPVMTNGKRFRCADVKIVVEGIDVTQASCIP